MKNSDPSVNEKLSEVPIWQANFYVLNFPMLRIFFTSRPSKR